MVRTIEFKEAQKKFNQIFDTVSEGINQYIIKRNDKKSIELLSYEEYQSLTKNKEQAKKRFFEMVNQIQEANKNIPSEQIEKDVDQAVKEVRQMNYDKADCQ
jgi:PHD/YefM family antitoxin component YafN of YafNO toxin-antitoxin module